MCIARLGAVATGLVWGWLLADHLGNSRRPWYNALVIIGATLILGAAIAWTVDMYATFLFMAAPLLTISIHLGWRRVLRLRCDSSARRSGKELET